MTIMKAMDYDRPTSQSSNLLQIKILHSEVTPIRTSHRNIMKSAPEQLLSYGLHQSKWHLYLLPGIQLHRRREDVKRGEEEKRWKGVKWKDKTEKMKNERRRKEKKENRKKKAKKRNKENEKHGIHILRMEAQHKPRQKTFVYRIETNQLLAISIEKAHFLLKFTAAKVSASHSAVFIIPAQALNHCLVTVVNLSHQAASQDAQHLIHQDTQRSMSNSSPTWNLSLLSIWCSTTVFQAILLKKKHNWTLGQQQYNFHKEISNSMVYKTWTEAQIKQNLTSTQWASLYQGYLQPQDQSTTNFKSQASNRKVKPTSIKQFPTTMPNTVATIISGRTFTKYTISKLVTINKFTQYSHSQFKHPAHALSYCILQRLSQFEGFKSNLLKYQHSIQAKPKMHNTSSTHPHQSITINRQEFGSERADDIAWCNVQSHSHGLTNPTLTLPPYHDVSMLYSHNQIVNNKINIISSLYCERWEHFNTYPLPVDISRMQWLGAIKLQDTVFFRYLWLAEGDESHLSAML